jgi:hypothetical protein
MKKWFAMLATFEAKREVFLRGFLSSYSNGRTGSYDGFHDGRGGPPGSHKIQEKACFSCYFGCCNEGLSAKTLVPLSKAYVHLREGDRETVTSCMLTG